MIAWLSKFLTIFDKEATVTYAAIIFPVIMAVLTGIAFFLFARKIFYKEDKKIANIIALIATAFFVLIPSLLPRTVAGIPEKESAAFFFIFIGFYFFLEAFTSEKLKRALIFGALAGIATGMLGLIWGGVTFMFLVIPGAVLFEFILGKIDNKRFFSYLLWIIGAMIIMIPFSTRYSPLNLIASVSTGLSFVILFILFIDKIIFEKKIFGIHKKIEKIKIPRRIISIIIAGIIITIIASIAFGVSFVPDIVKNIISDTIHPLAQSRFGVTVAENRQPYFISEWAGEFGPTVFNIPLYFWLFFIGSILFFGYLIRMLEKKEKIILTGSYLVMLICLIFSKYSSSSILNGESTTSIIVYLGGFLFFIGSWAYFYYKKYKEGKLPVFSELNFAYIFYLVTLTMAIIAARGAVRLIMVFGAVSPIAIAFLIIKSIQRYFNEKDDVKKLFIFIITLLILIASLFTIWTYYHSDKGMAESYVPGMYQWQWQKAMAWVRENTLGNSVFAHWWDYGYWLQSIGERATILDGGNAVGYWNHFMGRHVLTGSNERTALDFLYAHNGTHLLIDSTEIGKYGAYSSIGSDEYYDRYSWIPTIFMDESQTQETNNETLYVYPIGTVLDEDIIINKDGKDILLPKGKAFVAVITLKERTNGEIGQPMIFFVYNEKQYSEPLRYIYIKGKLYDFKAGIEAGIFIFPRLDQTLDGRLSVNEKGAAFYLSKRTVHSGIARLYLFNEESDYFKLVHTEDNLINEQLKEQGMSVGDFVYYQGFQGPIKIWEISYPKDIKLNESYLDTEFPEELDTTLGDY
ncbi:hypothetical protein A3K82_03335 [Candidatus Pacearchaeota archaeon RBG_19FT_COMBO_34_9]|nr:MAG: hypothetical protein A3K82_03335 [Candidatus Pacearchaeota archaeon RBG_19FT_COMBO_34_9]